MSETCGLLCLTFQKRWTTKKKTACYEMLSILFRRRQRVANQAAKLFIHHGVIQSKLCATWIIFFPCLPNLKLFSVISNTKHF